MSSKRKRLSDTFERSSASILHKAALDTKRTVMLLFMGQKLAKDKANSNAQTLPGGNARSSGLNESKVRLESVIVPVQKVKCSFCDRTDHKNSEVCIECNLSYCENCITYSYDHSETRPLCWDCKG